MISHNQASEIIEIVPNLRNEAVEILSLAFRDYPILRYYFPDSATNLDAQLRKTFELCFDWREVYGWTFIGIVAQNHLKAVAVFTEPNPILDQNLVEKADQEFINALGETVAQRIGRYVEVKHEYLPTVPHFYLDMLTVHPQSQGQGYGKALLNWLDITSQQHPTSMGIGLDTETSTNVALYEHCGYRVTATTQLEGIPIWCMFREHPHPKTQP